MAGRHDHWRRTGIHHSSFPDMKKINLLFFLSFGIFLLNLFLQRLPVKLPAFFSSYLNDLLCMPIVLFICQYLIRKISQKKQLKIPLFTAFSLAAFYSVYFEYYLPKVTERYTSDVLDILLYFGGSLIFWLVQQTDTPKNMQQKQ